MTRREIQCQLSALIGLCIDRSVFTRAEFERSVGMARMRAEAAGVPEEPEQSQIDPFALLSLAMGADQLNPPTNAKQSTEGG